MQTQFYITAVDLFGLLLEFLLFVKYFDMLHPGIHMHACARRQMEISKLKFIFLPIIIILFSHFTVEPGGGVHALSKVAAGCETADNRVL